jgi:hypothetical protein
LTSPCCAASNNLRNTPSAADKLLLLLLQVPFLFPFLFLVPFPFPFTFSFLFRASNAAASMLEWIKFDVKFILFWCG